MQLKSCTDIKIDDKSVERIRMFGQIVWERIQETTTTLTISPKADTEEEGYYKITKNNTFILRATVIPAKEEPVESGKVKFLETIGDDTHCIGEKDIKNGQAELSLQATDLGKRTYTAIFQPTKKYKTSSSNINVVIKKDKPILSMVGDTETIYNGWKVGVKMTASDGRPLEGKPFGMYVHFKSYGCCRDPPEKNKLTNEKGIVTLDIRSLPAGQHKVYFHFSGDEEYEEVTISHTYKVEWYKKITLNAYDWSYETGAKRQAWRSDDKKNFYCLERRSDRNSGRTIAAHSGSLNTPAPLIIAFNPPQLSYIASITLRYQSDQIPAVSNSYGGAHFEKAPTIQISFDNIGYHSPSLEEGNQQPINFPSRNYYADFYASYGPIMQNVVWNYYKANDGAGREPNPGLIHAKIIYEENSLHGVEEGFLTVEGVELIIEYTDKQKPFWE